MESEFLDESFLLEQYEKDNYKVTNNASGRRVVVIYFSSNAIYYPNDYAHFSSSILEQDKYEWENIRIKDAGISIYLRDIFKQWYEKGINKTINTRAKIFDFLKKQIPPGWECITVGSSAGGYMAALAGSVLKAKYVFDFSGQNSLDIVKSNNPFIWNNRNQGIEFYDIRKAFKKNGYPKIYYIYSGNNEDDVVQFGIMEALPYVKALCIDSETHGRTIMGIGKYGMLNSSEKRLDYLFELFQGKKTNIIVATMVFCGARGMVWAITTKIIRLITREKN
ncbi:MAG: hypothetical protein J6H31_08315 [Butyrivibrio sp.]|nr:hypothetical protein [Butyrivibrio sp.]